MPVQILKANLKKITLIVNCFLFLFASYLLAADKVGNVESDQVSGMVEQARLYRLEGLKLQDSGDLETALKLYQKAAELDPGYSVVFNDLGIIYEIQEQPERAEASYLQAIKLDPHLLSAYTNLALLYEKTRQLEKAAYCWQKRVELGNPDDVWTLKAQRRLADLRLVLSQDPLESMPVVPAVREQDVSDFTDQISNTLAIEKTKQINH